MSLPAANNANKNDKRASGNPPKAAPLSYFLLESVRGFYID
jgi:hypothetical protein